MSIYSDLRHEAREHHAEANDMRSYIERVWRWRADPPTRHGIVRAIDCARQADAKSAAALSSARDYEHTIGA